MNTLERRIVTLLEDRQEFITDDDGYVYFWPDGYKFGHFSANTLRGIADELDIRNEEWERELDKTVNRK